MHSPPVIRSYQTCDMLCSNLNYHCSILGSPLKCWLPSRVSVVKSAPPQNACPFRRESFKVNLAAPQNHHRASTIKVNPKSLVSLQNVFARTIVLQSRLWFERYLRDIQNSPWLLPICGHPVFVFQGLIMCWKLNPLISMRSRELSCQTINYQLWCTQYVLNDKWNQLINISHCVHITHNVSGHWCVKIFFFLHF
jgi:hypothetical protein